MSWLIHLLRANSSQVLYTSRLAFFCCLLATVLLVGLSVVTTFLGPWLARKFTMNAPRPLYIALKTIEVLSELPSPSKMMIRIVAGVSLYALGFIHAEMLRYNHTHTYYDVGIVAQHDPFNYTLRFLGSDWGEIFCPSYRPTFQPGEKLKYLTIVDEGNCWNLSDGSFQYYKKDGKAIHFKELTNGQPDVSASARGY